MGAPSAPPRRTATIDRTAPPENPQDPEDTGRPGAGGDARQRMPAARLSGSGFCWVAAHGGAGTTSLATVLGGTDVGCRWPDPGKGEPARVLLVARTHAAGTRAASRALNAMREGRHPPGMELVTLVLVADAPGSLPLALSSRVRVLRSVAPVLRIPWIAEWRSGKRARALPKQLFRLGELVGTRPREMP